MISNSKKKLRLKSTHWFVIVGLTPIFALYTYLRFIPILRTFYMSFFNWDMVALHKPFVGFMNYRQMFQDGTFLLSLKNTTLIAFGVLFFSVAIALPVAAFLAGKIKFKSWFESIYFLPFIMPMVPVVVVWKWILDKQHGLMNYFLSFFGISPQAWLFDPPMAVASVIILTVWKTIGYNMLIFLVGLRGIPKEYYEAASIDGATNLKAFRHITLPLLKPITVFVSVITLIHGYNAFSQIYILASDVQGSPGYVVRVIVYDMIENGFRFFKMGYASAEAVVLFLIVFALTLIQMGLAREKTTSGKGLKK